MFTKAIAAIAAAACLMLPTLLHAAVVYTGSGECTFRARVTSAGPSPIPCSGDFTALVELSDDYVPGTPFDESEFESFLYRDDLFEFFTPAGTATVVGNLPDGGLQFQVPAAGAVFQFEADGDWNLELDISLPRDRSELYVVAGTGWAWTQEISEPVSLALVLLGIALIGAARGRIVHQGKPAAVNARMRGTRGGRRSQY